MYSVRINEKYSMKLSKFKNRNELLSMTMLLCTFNMLNTAVALVIESETYSLLRAPRY